jgi:hypothetical protein
MSKVSPQVLIVDRTGHWGVRLRDQLTCQGVRAYVADTSTCALAIARRKPGLAAILETANDDELCWNLRELGVEPIYLFAPVNSANITSAIMEPGHRMLK